MSTEKLIVTFGHSKFHIIQYEQISKDFLINVVQKTKNQTRLLGLTVIVGQISAA
jgi:hypothetical protein